MNRFLATLALACAFSGSAKAQSYTATLVRVIDGDTAVVSVPAWAATPFGMISVRIAGIDAPESRKPPAKCKAEVALGKAASAYARGLVTPGTAMLLTYRGFDKYGGRIDGALSLPDGRDWATVMLAAGMARPYAGGKKLSWCRKPPASGL
jgi:micrococcal nuclease